MSAPRRLALRSLAILLLGSCVACGELGKTPVVRFGQRSLTADDLRTAYADLEPAARPSLATRDDRREFVERLVERRLLLDEGERLLAADSATARDVAERRSILVRRLRTIEAGDSPIDSAAVAAAYQRMRTTHHVDVFCFAREDDARTAKQKGLAGTEGTGAYRYDMWLVWSPFPDAVADAVVDLPIGQLGGPVRAGGGWRLVRVRERKPYDPGSIDPLRPHIFQGLRGRRESAAVDELAGRLRAAANVQLDSAAIQLLVESTRKAILRPGSAEQDEAWAMPTLNAEQESTRVATWKDGALTLGDYVRVLRRQPRGQRPRWMLEAEIRRTVDMEVTSRLLFAEAERRGLAAEYWVLRALERSRQERALQRAIVEIERTGRESDVDTAADSLTTHLQATQPDLFAQSARARVLRFDFPTAEAGQAEIERIRRAGGPEARLRAILDGDAPPMGLYHLLYVTPAEMPSQEVVPRIFASGPGAVSGPHRLGDTWVVLACLDVQASTQASREQVLSELRARLAENAGARRVEEWLKRRKTELGVDVDDAALDALAPGG